MIKLTMLECIAIKEALDYAIDEFDAMEADGNVLTTGADTLVKDARKLLSAAMAKSEVPVE